MTSMQRLTRRASRRPIYEPGPTAVTVNLGLTAIERLLPHRDPFLFLDRIDLVDLEVGAAVGRRTISEDDPVFRGHFPDSPVYPGVLQIEMAGQLGLCLEQLLALGRTEVRADDHPRPLRLIKVADAGFVRPTLPGDELTILARVVEASDYVSSCLGQITGADSEVRCFAAYEVYKPFDDDSGQEH